MATYRFLDKDPIVDEIRTIYQGKYSQWSMAALAAKARLAPSTVGKIFAGDTKRPQNRTVDAILDALGFERRIIRKTQAGRKLEIVQ